MGEVQAKESCLRNSMRHQPCESLHRGCSFNCLGNTENVGDVMILSKATQIENLEGAEVGA